MKKDLDCKEFERGVRAVVDIILKSIKVEGSDIAGYKGYLSDDTMLMLENIIKNEGLQGNLLYEQEKQNENEPIVAENQP
jgi:hypothetical protein